MAFSLKPFVNLGTVHFLSGGGGGGSRLLGFDGGGHEKNYGFKGGSKEKGLGLKGGGSLKNSFKFCSDSICNNANSLPECQKTAVLTFRKF